VVGARVNKGAEKMCINDIIDSIEAAVKENAKNYSADTLFEFQKTVEILEIAKVYVQRIDWLLSGDDGEDTFHERLREDLAKIGATVTDNTCIWREDSDGYYETVCGRHYATNAGTLKDNGIRFCPFCGREIKEEKSNA
jgi:hypothetical protein